MDKIYYAKMIESFKELENTEAIQGKQIYLFGHCNATEELADLLLEHQPQSRGNLQFLVKLLLRDAFPKLSAFGEAQHTPTLLFYHKEAN